MNDFIQNELDRIADLAAGSYDYVVRLRNMVLCSDDDASVEAELGRILDDPSVGERRRFDAYYALSILYRRHERVSDFCALTERYNDCFKDSFPLTQVNRALYFRYKYRTSEDWDYLLCSIECAEKAVDAIADNPGIYQTYAESVALALEKGVDTLPDDKVRKALRLVDRALERKSYPKYYSTKGRRCSSGDGSTRRANSSKRRSTWSASATRTRCCAPHSTTFT